MARRKSRDIGLFIFLSTYALIGEFIIGCNEDNSIESSVITAYLLIDPSTCLRCVGLVDRITDSVRQSSGSQTFIYGVAVIDRAVDCEIAKTDQLNGDTIICVDREWWSNQFPNMRDDVLFIICGPKDTLGFTLRESETEIDTAVSKFINMNFRSSGQ